MIEPAPLGEPSVEETFYVVTEHQGQIVDRGNFDTFEEALIYANAELGGNEVHIIKHTCTTALLLIRPPL